MKIAYLKHPLSPARKKEFKGKGFKIIDLRFKPEKTANGDHVDKPEAKAKPEKTADK